jgi:hypothetical protein
MTEPHSKLFHVALLEVRRIARTGGRDAAAWLQVVETVQKALAEAHRRDLAGQQLEGGRR